MDPIDGLSCSESTKVGRISSGIIVKSREGNFEPSDDGVVMNVSKGLLETLMNAGNMTALTPQDTDYVWLGWSSDRDWQIFKRKLPTR